jgi:agmatinase
VLTTSDGPYYFRMFQRIRQTTDLKQEFPLVDTGRRINSQNNRYIDVLCPRRRRPLRETEEQNNHASQNGNCGAPEMSDNNYESGRLNLPFVGHCTFGKQPVCLDWDAIDADAAILGAPLDMGTQYRAGARFGPRAIREASTLFSFGHGGAYDHEDDVTYLPVDKVRLVDVGDADIIHTDTMKSHDNIEWGVRKILKAGALPVVLGGDHSVHIPCIRAFDDQEPVHIVHIDAHLDFVDERHGVRYGHGNPLRRASEMNHVTGFSQLGIRNVSSSNRDDYAAARAAGSDILSVRQFRELGPKGVLARVPEGKRYYLTIDIDGFDPSIAPGTGTPSHGGFLYYEILEFLQGLTARGDVVGIDLVEVAPDYDRDGTTAFLAAQILMNLLGFIFHEQGKSA